MSESHLSALSAAPGDPGPKASRTAMRILTAAESLFVERNYADVSVDAVARAAEVTKGAVYHHFGAKESLYVAMLRRDFEEKERLFREAVNLCDCTRARLSYLTELFFALPPIKRALMGLLRRDINILGEPERSTLVRAYQRALPEQVEAILRDGIAAGEIMPVDPRLLAWQFVALVEVLLTPYADARLGADADKVNYATSIFLRGAARATSEA